MFQNKFFINTNKLSANLTQNSEKSKLLNEFKERTYQDTNKQLNLYIKCIKFICSSVSVLTAFSFFAMFIYLSINHLIGFYPAAVISVCIGFTGVAILEVAKTNSIDTLTKEYLQYKIFRIELFLIAALCLSVSVITSYQGAKELPTITAPPAIITNIDSIKQDYTKRIEQAIILNTYKPTNTLTKTGAKIVQALEQDKAKEVQSAQATNLTNVQSVQGKIKGLELTFCSVSALIEVFILLCSFYGVFYRFNCYLEALANEDSDTPQDTTQDTEQPQKTTIQHTGNAAPITNNAGQRIGFYDVKQKTCTNCGEHFISNHKKQIYCTDSCRFSFHAKNKKNAAV